MAAYIITQITITDPEKFKKYVELSPASIRHYGGRHIARGARTITLEGEESTTRNGIIQFDSVDAALRLVQFVRIPRREAHSRPFNGGDVQDSRGRLTRQSRDRRRR